MENLKNLEQLKKLAQIFNTDKLISPEEIQQIFTGIVEILATYKKGTESINEDTKKVVNKLLEDVISAHEEGMNKAVTTVLSEKENLANGFTEKLTELKLAIDSIKEEMDKEDKEPEDDNDEEEKQALIEEIMAQIKLPEYKETIVTGEEIIDKINELPLEEENKIDWNRIKNAPSIKGKTMHTPTVLRDAVDLDGSTRQNNYAIVWDDARGRYTHAAAGGGSGTVDSIVAGTNISVDSTDPANPIVNSLADRYKTTSTTSNTIVSTGSLTFTVDANLAYIPLQEVLIVHDSSNHMHATVTSYSGTTLIVDVKQKTGSGTYNSWTINLDGTPVDAITGVGTANEITYFTAPQVIGSLTTTTYPNLTELSRVKGVTAPIQTQLDSKISNELAIAYAVAL